MFLEEEKKESRVRIFIPACDGTISLQKSRKLFLEGYYFAKKGCVERPTPATNFDLRTFHERKTFNELRDLLLQEKIPYSTEHQVVEFVKLCKDDGLLLPLGHSVFFLLDEGYYAKIQSLRLGIDATKNTLDHIVLFEGKNIIIAHAVE